jgi:hypothetical protein
MFEAMVDTSFGGREKAIRLLMFRSLIGLSGCLSSPAQ